MNLASHLDQLKARHESLKIKIKEEETHPSADHLDIVALKREKLQVKEEIERISRQPH